MLPPRPIRAREPRSSQVFSRQQTPGDKRPMRVRLRWGCCFSCISGPPKTAAHIAYTRTRYTSHHSLLLDHANLAACPAASEARALEGLNSTLGVPETPLGGGLSANFPDEAQRLRSTRPMTSLIVLESAWENDG